jgi:hypothetical protein
MKKEPSPQETFTKTITKNDKKYDVIVRSYAEPIRKTDLATCFTRVSIMDGQVEYGHVLLPNPVSADEAESVFKFVEEEFSKLKNPSI